MRIFIFLSLKNATGTKLQVNGAAYGHGIYLSPHAGTSFTYSKMLGGQDDKKSAPSPAARVRFTSTHVFLGSRINKYSDYVGLFTNRHPRQRFHAHPAFFNLCCLYAQN